MGVSQFKLSVVPGERDSNLVVILRTNPKKKFIVFCDSYESCSLLNTTLQELDIRSICIFGYRDSEYLKLIKEGTSKVLVCTSNLFEQVNVSEDFDIIINYDTPKTLKDYDAKVNVIKTGEAITIILLWKKEDLDDLRRNMPTVIDLPVYKVDDTEAQHCFVEVREARLKAIETLEKAIPFDTLGLSPQVVKRCAELGWIFPSKIQAKAIPLILKGKDVIGLAKCGSGKTGAFALPIIHLLLEKPSEFFACIISPNQILSDKIAGQFETLGSEFGIKCATVPRRELQAFMDCKPHIIVSTPSCLEPLKEEGFCCSDLKYLVLDDPDLLLEKDLTEVKKVMDALSGDCRLLVFSATKVRALQEYLTNAEEIQVVKHGQIRYPIKIESFLDTLDQTYRFIPAKYKDSCLIYYLKTTPWRKTLIFCRGSDMTHILCGMLKKLELGWVMPFRAKIDEVEEKSMLDKFASHTNAILVVSLDVGLPDNISMVDFILYYDLPTNSQEYAHRVGRTKKSGVVISLVDESSVDYYLKIQNRIGRKLLETPADLDKIQSSLKIVSKAKQAAEQSLKENKSGKRYSKTRV